MAESSKLHRLTIGPNGMRAEAMVSDGGTAKTVDDLFSLWVHRCAGINAAVLASIPYRLVSIADGLAKREAMLRAPHVRKLAKSTRAAILGGDDLATPWTVTKATRYHLDDAVELESHPVLDLLAQANDWTDGYGLMESIAYDLQLFSEAFLFVSTGQAGDTGNPAELWRMVPSFVKPKPDPKDFISGFEYRQGADVETFSRAEVVWFRRYSPTNPYRGVGELAAWSKYAESSEHIAEFNRWLMERHGAPEFVVTSERPQTEAEKRTFRTRWRQLFGRLYKRRESVAFLSGDAKLERLSQSNKELEFSESSRLVRDFICAGFGVPKALVTPEDANRATTKEANDQHLRLTVWPLACRIFDALNEQLLALYGGRLLLVPENPIRQDAATLVAERSSKLASGYSINEVRVESGDEPLKDPNADVPMVAGGIVPLDRAIAGPPDPFGGFGLGGPGPEDDEAQEDDGEEPEPEEEAEEADEEDGPVQRSFDSVFIQCGCRTLGKRISQRDLFLDGLFTKAAGLDVRDALDDESVRLLYRAILPVMTGLRTTLDEVSDQVGFDGLDSLDDDVLRAATRNAADALQNPLTEVLTSQAQATINSTSPGMGVAFNRSNPRVVDYVQRSSQRIAETVVGRSNADLTGRLMRMIRNGENPRKAAKSIAMDAQVERFAARRIARTERVFASTQGVVEGWEASPVVRGKRFVLSANPCELCEAAAKLVDGRVFDPTEPVFPNPTPVRVGDRELSLDYLPGGLQGPPVHPNCRCSVRPVFNS